ncbi:MAG: hypothetical protein AB1817_10850 [Chloroflexota bacterium]
MRDRSERYGAAWLALLLLGIYLLTYSGQIYSGDGMSMFSVTESFVKRGEWNTDQLWTLFKSRGEIAADGESYAKYGCGTSLLIAPLYAFAQALPGLGLAQTTLLASAFAIAFAGALVFLAARRLQFSRGASVGAALLFGLATPAWVYARELWSEPFGLVTLFAAFYFLQCYRAGARARDAFIAGVAFALAVATRVTNVALAPVFAWYGFWNGANERAATNTPSRSASTRWRDVALFAAPLVLIAFSIAWYDWVRFGNALATGYRTDETFDNPLPLGLYGLLFSPGKGLFVYVPIFAALPFSGAALARRAQRETILIGVVAAFYVLLFSAWYYWWGGTSWGPRFLVPTLPFLALALAPAIELAIRAQTSRSWKLFAAIFSLLCLLSFAIELLGVSIPALAYRVRMIRISANPEMDAVFLPQFSPLVGYLNLLKPSALNFAWVRVQEGGVAVDWLVVALTLGLVGICGLALRVLLAAHPPARLAKAASSRSVLLVMVMCASAFTLVALYRATGDLRLGDASYRALLQTVQREATARDVLVLNDDAHTPFFLNENRAPMRWYGLSRDPKQFDDATRALLTRLSRQYARVWFAFDDANASLPNPMKDWFEQTLRPAAQRDFDDGVHLILYETDPQP